MPVVVGHHRLPRLAGADFFSIDDQWNLDALVRHRFEALLERLLLRRARGVAFDGLVDGRRHTTNAGKASEWSADRRDRSLGLLRLGGGARRRTRVTLRLFASALGSCDGCGHGVLDVSSANWDERSARGTPFAHGQPRRLFGRSPASFEMALSNRLMVSRLSQAIRIFRALLLVTGVAACAGDDIAWTDPLTMSTASDDARLTVDSKGRARLVADTSVSATPSSDGASCASSVRAARLDDGTLAATWWALRPDSSAVLFAALSSDGGKS